MRVAPASQCTGLSSYAGHLFSGSLQKKMSILSSFFTDDLAIDLGTVNTLIYAPERGVVLNEPSAVAIHKYTGEVLSVGREAYKMLGRDPKATRVDLIDEGLCAALGAGLGFEDERAHLVVDIGGGTTNVAIVASGAIVSSASVPAAGNAMDEAIRDYVRAKYEMQLGERSAEQWKMEVSAALREADG